MKAPLVAILLLSCSTLFAQIQRGNFLLGGNVTGGQQVTKVSSTKYTINSFNQTATVGYFVANGFCLGLGLPYEMKTQKSKGDFKYKYSTTTYGIKPFARYYIPVSSLFIVTECMGILTASGSDQEFEFDNTTSKSNTKGTSVGFDAGVGVAFRLNNHTLLELMGNYKYIKSTMSNDDPLSADSKTTDGNLFFSVGFNFLIPGK
jgi:hypothetical protein